MQSKPDEKNSFAWYNELTPREREIFDFITLGYDDEEIASALNMAVQTVRNHVTSIYSTLGVKNRFESICLGTSCISHIKPTTSSKAEY
jgi:DNA-binding NarL/FixJ family response regulator